MKMHRFIASALLAAAPFVAHATLIDDFSCVQQTAQTSTPGGYDSDSAVASCAIGGYRFIDVQNLNGAPASVISTTSTDPFTSPQYLEFTNGTGDLADGTVAWWGDGTGFGPLTLDGSGFLLSYKSDNGGNVGDALQLTLRVFMSPIDYADVVWTVGNTGGVFVDHSVSFASFTGIDFTKVDAIALYMHTTDDDVDFALDFIKTVPEPGTLSLLGLSLLGLGALTRRRS